MNAGSCGGPERKSLGTAKEHNQIAARRMSRIAWPATNPSPRPTAHHGS